uniref:Myelin-associated neurite-outgrowth inhibitor n=1 Tax=Eptatretus burgeri TaxID=7764 RepID=A0A8C4QQP7_EPTBU
MNPAYGAPPGPATSLPPTKGFSYPGFPHGYSSPAPPYTPCTFAGTAPYNTGFGSSTPYKISPGQARGPPPAYQPSPGPSAYHPFTFYPVRSPYAAQAQFAQPGMYLAPTLYAPAPAHVIHHTTVVQPNGLPAQVYPQLAAPRTHPALSLTGHPSSSIAMATAGSMLAAPTMTPIAGQPMAVGAYRAAPGLPAYTCVQPPW